MVVGVAERDGRVPGVDVVDGAPVLVCGLDEPDSSELAVVVELVDVSSEELVGVVDSPDVVDSVGLVEVVVSSSPPV